MKCVNFLPQHVLLKAGILLYMGLQKGILCYEVSGIRHGLWQLCINAPCWQQLVPLAMLDEGQRNMDIVEEQAQL
jgi:hypothetical protein